jgi:hypothetical protein
MGRTIPGLVALLAFLLTAAPVAAGTMWHFTMSGRGASAFFWTNRAGGPSEPATVTVMTDLVAGEKVEWTDHVKYPTAQLVFRQTTTGYDSSGNWVFVSEIVGYATGDAVAFSADSRLNSASAVATVTLARCGYDYCEPYGTADVRVTWTGQGEISRGVGNSVSISGGTTFTSHGRYAYRDATVSASIGGSDPAAGDLFGSDARIYNVSSADLAVCQGRC